MPNDALKQFFHAIRDASDRWDLVPFATTTKYAYKATRKTTFLSHLGETSRTIEVEKSALDGAPDEVTKWFRPDLRPNLPFALQHGSLDWFLSDAASLDEELKDLPGAPIDPVLKDRGLYATKQVLTWVKVEPDSGAHILSIDDGRRFVVSPEAFEALFVKVERP
jgi:hypothetical protein